MRRLFAGLLLLIPTVLSAQSKQFEGEIHYLHLFHFKVAGLDTASIANSFGTASKYYYKNGAYKWTFENCSMEVEYHDGQTGEVHDKYKTSDTLFFSNTVFTDKILKYEVFKNADTICGYVCDRLEVMIGKPNDRESVLMRNIYFSRDLPLDPSKFKDFTAFCTNEVFKITKSIPLRIEMDVAYWPFIMRFEAVKVVNREVSEKEVTLPPGSITARK